jgi:hypothetical protein
MVLSLELLAEKACLHGVMQAQSAVEFDASEWRFAMKPRRVGMRLLRLALEIL